MAPGKKKKTKDAQSKGATTESRAHSKLAGGQKKEQEAEVRVSLALHAALSTSNLWCESLPNLHLD